MKPEGGARSQQAAPKRKQAERLSGNATEQAAIELSLREVTAALVSMLPVADSPEEVAGDSSGENWDASWHWTKNSPKVVIYL